MTQTTRTIFSGEDHGPDDREEQSGFIATRYEDDDIVDTSWFATSSELDAWLADQSGWVLQ